jgi:hypothetical protein
MVRLGVPHIPQPHDIAPNVGDKHHCVDLRSPGPRNHASEAWGWRYLVRWQDHGRPAFLGFTVSVCCIPAVPRIRGVGGHTALLYSPCLCYSETFAIGFGISECFRIPQAPTLLTHIGFVGVPVVGAVVRCRVGSRHL